MQMSDKVFEANFRFLFRFDDFKLDFFVGNFIQQFVIQSVRTELDSVFGHFSNIDNRKVFTRKFAVGDNRRDCFPDAGRNEKNRRFDLQIAHNRKGVGIIIFPTVVERNCDSVWWKFTVAPVKIY